jgi:hypothetical protein
LSPLECNTEGALPRAFKKTLAVERGVIQRQASIKIDYRVSLKGFLLFPSRFAFFEQAEAVRERGSTKTALVGAALGPLATY